MMADLSAQTECRRDLRVPVRGEAILYSDMGRMHATLDNLSRSGMMLTLASPPIEVDPSVDVELRMLGGGGWVSGYVIRVEQDGDRWHVAIGFDCIEHEMRDRIERAVTAARSTIQSRPVLVIDDRNDRRMRLVEQLKQRGFTPLAPKTPLEAMDFLSRPQLHVDVCLLGGTGFALTPDELAAILSDTFPWVTTAKIDDDLEATTERASDAWTASPVAQIAYAVG